jgi:hypothetical protein
MSSLYVMMAFYHTSFKLIAGFKKRLPYGEDTGFPALALTLEPTYGAGPTPLLR